MSSNYDLNSEFVDLHQLIQIGYLQFTHDFLINNKEDFLW